MPTARRRPDESWCFAKVSSQEREGESGEVGTAAGATEHGVGDGVAGFFELDHCFLTDHGLVQHDVVQHATE